MGVAVGTSGWAYPEWQPAFYPPGLPRSAFLTHYAGVLTACEINATFYRVQREETVAGWAERVPPGFRFAVKAHRGLGGREAGPLRERFLASIAPLGDRLGALLLQVDPRRRRDDALLERMLAVPPPGVAFALDARHESWDDPAVDEEVLARGGTRCLTETEGRVPERLPEGPVAYVRLRGDAYDDAARAGWLELLAGEGERRRVLAFAKHEGAPPDDPHVGVGLAAWLAERLGRPARPGA
jgi:uncharacterized protein YecE (DUF72 family)